MEVAVSDFVDQSFEVIVGHLSGAAIMLMLMLLAVGLTLAIGKLCSGRWSSRPWIILALAAPVAGLAVGLALAETEGGGLGVSQAAYRSSQSVEAPPGASVTPEEPTEAETEAEKLTEATEPETTQLTRTTTTTSSAVSTSAVTATPDPPPVQPPGTEVTEVVETVTTP
jgi:hypothetical protein